MPTKHKPTSALALHLEATKSRGHDRTVADLRSGFRQRSTRVPSGKAYRRTVGKRVEA